MFRKHTTAQLAPSAETPPVWGRSKALLESERRRPQVHPNPQVHQQLQRMQSFSDLLLPRFDLGDGTIGLRDLNSSGMLFDILPLASEARPEAMLEQSHRRITQALRTVFPGRKKNPWLAQFFVYDDNLMYELIASIRKYARANDSLDEYYEHWHRLVVEHLSDIASDQGAFREEGGNLWRARHRRLRLCVWRKISPGESVEPSETLDAVAERLKSALLQADIKLQQLDGQALFEWMCWWFASAVQRAKASVDQRVRWEPDLASSDLSRSALQGAAPTTTADGLWWFQQRPCRYLTIDEPTRVPNIGHLTADRQIGDAHQTLWDRMPPGSIWSMTVVFVDQDETTDHIKRVRHHSIGGDPAVNMRRDIADEALNAQADQQPIWRVFAGIYVTADDLNRLNQRVGKVTAVMTGHGLRVIAPDHDPIAHDSFIRALPFGYDYEQDRRWYAKRARLWHSDHAVRMTPFFGRSIGTRNPGILQFNRGAEPLAYDPLHEQDRRKNAHALILGPTGSGKTSLLIYQLLHLLAVRRPRLFLITALPTFGLFSDWCKRCGLTVQRKSIGHDRGVTLPPFAAASELKNEQTGAQDPLGEMEILARLMITGGDQADERALRRSDVDLLRSAIEYAAHQTPAGRQTTTTDVVNALNEAANGQLGDLAIPKERQGMATDMAGAMHLFCTGANGAIFDRPGAAWPEADVTVVELGYFARKGYEDRMAVAVTSLMRSIQDLVESQQYSNRQTVVVVDEAHVLLQNPLVSPYLARIVSTWRTFGAWLWIATQNLRQFPDSAKELLNQPEWWVVMAVDADEIDQISRFRQLTEEQRALVLSASKSPGKYTEGAIISGRLLNLFRSVPPALALALAQTEKHEKSQRHQLMEEHNLDELEAAEHIAQQIRQQRQQR